jgi:branched-chain amino acid transport system substrate-binding protein
MGIGSRRLVAIVVVVLLLGACGSDDGETGATTETSETVTTNTDEAPITVAAINQEDGVVSFADESQAVKALFDWYNANGGLDGRPLELDLCTAGDDPESTQVCAQRYANDDDVAFVYSIMVPIASAMCDALANAGKPVAGQNSFDIPDMVQPDVFNSDPGLVDGNDSLDLHDRGAWPARCRNRGLRL